MKNQFLTIYTYCLVSNNDNYYVSKDYDNTIKIREGEKGFFLKKRNEFTRTKTKKTNFQFKKKRKLSIKNKKKFLRVICTCFVKSGGKKILASGNL